MLPLFGKDGGSFSMRPKKRSAGNCLRTSSRRQRPNSSSQFVPQGRIRRESSKVFMREYGVTIIRPLIYVAEDSIRSFSKEYGFARITCQCPVGQNSKRKTVDQYSGKSKSIFPMSEAISARRSFTAPIKQRSLEIIPFLR